MATKVAPAAVSSSSVTIRVVAPDTTARGAPAAPLPSAFKSPKGEAAYLTAYDATMHLWPVPYETMDLRSRFGSTHVAVCGPQDAPPLVLIHGVQVSLTMWANNIADFSQNHRVYALDAMGQWSKSVPDEPIRTREELATWLTETLDALGLGRIPLVGMSYGGWIALNYAIHAPDRLTKLVLLSPASGLAPFRLQFIARLALTQFVPHVGWVLMPSVMRWMCFKENLRDPAMRELWERLTTQITRGARYWRIPASEAVQVPPVPFTDDDLRGVTTPTLLLIGEQEVLYDPVAAVERGKRLMPQIVAELLPRASHEMAMSLREIVDRRTLAFVDG